MASIGELGSRLADRDAIEQRLVPLIITFLNASERAVRAESSLPSHPDGEFPNSPSVDSELVSRLQESRDNLEHKLGIVQTQLEQAQERLRSTTEVEYLKLSAVQGLHDEILSLTLQLNLSEEKRKQLQNDLGR